MKKSGFTLIELLVVIVIIGILASISVPAFNGFFQQARDGEREANLKNIYTIVLTDQNVKDSPSYCDLGSDGDDSNNKDELKVLLAAQGASLPEEKNNGKYYYFCKEGTAGGSGHEFAVAVCLEKTETVAINGTPNALADLTTLTCENKDGDLKKDAPTGYTGEDISKDN